jgi:P-type Cu+ transporter
MEMQGAAATGHMAIDPVCGMKVDPHTAKHRAEYGGRPYYFCSAGCREKFLTDPERYLKSSDKSPTRNSSDNLYLSHAP